MRKVFFIASILGITITSNAQTALSLDSCRALAIANNKELLISNEKINAAHYQRKAAFTNYLPGISANAGYMRNQKEISLLSNSQKEGLSGLGTTVGSSIQQAGAAIGQMSPELAQLLSPILNVLQSDLVPAFNGVGQSLVDALRTDNRNMFAGAVTLTQPLYMGGKIRAYNKITKYAEELARQQHNSGMQEVILSTDQVYWQVVSLVNKKTLAESYLNLLEKLDDDEIGRAHV